MFKIKIFTRVSVLSQVASRNLSTYWVFVGEYLAQGLMDILKIFWRYLWKIFPNLHLAPPLGVNCKYFWIFGTDTCKLLLIWLIFENICPQPVCVLSQPQTDLHRGKLIQINQDFFDASLIFSSRFLLAISPSRIQQCCKWERSGLWCWGLRQDLDWKYNARWEPCIWRCRLGHVYFQNLSVN